MKHSTAAQGRHLTLKFFPQPHCFCLSGERLLQDLAQLSCAPSFLTVANRDNPRVEAADYLGVDEGSRRKSFARTTLRIATLALPVLVLFGRFALIGLII